MKLRKVISFALPSCVTIALLTGCGASQPPIGATGTMPQSRTIATQAARRRSWMLPEAKNDDLLYVSRGAAGEVQVYTYPKGAVVGTLTGLAEPEGLCVDQSGDIFVVTSEQIVVYAHGGTTPIKTLDDTGNAPHGCAIDPTTGNLAVSGGLYQNTEANVAIYANGSGSPTVYKDGFVSEFVYCTYDNEGNLFTNGGPITELPSGSSSFIGVTVNQRLNPGYPGLQWDGRYVAIQNPSTSKRGPTTILQVSISQSTGTIVNSISLSSRKHKNNYHNAQFWIQGASIVNAEAQNGNVGLWHYPTGKEAYKTVKVQPSLGTLDGLAVSPTSHDRQ